MKILYTKSFERDIDDVHSNPDIRKRLLGFIERLREIDSLVEVPGVRKIEGYASYFRARIGDYRLGMKMAENTLELIRFLHRKDIYRRFP